MPLLSGKVYILNKRVKKGSGEGEEKREVSGIIVESTGEVCATEEEASRKRLLYGERIWSCRITGQSSLTLKEALKSEQGAAKVVKNAVKRCHESVLLAQVHHSRDSLENIIHKAWTLLHEEFCINEPVVIKLTSPKQLSLKGAVVKIDRSLQENGDLENSPAKVPSDASISDKENIKKKTVPVKKPYQYSVRLFEMDKLVNDIPADTIERTLRPPSKDQIRMFIRSHAIRHSNKNIYPWIVDDDIVKKYKLPNLEPEFVNDKVKLKDMSLNAEVQMYNKLIEENNKKKVSSTVDLTFSDDENDKKISKPQKIVVERSGSKQLKQMTLLDLHSTNASTPKPHTKIKSPFTSPSRQMPPIAQQLLRLMKDTPTDPMINQLLLKCCQYTEVQISRFPELIRVPIKEKKDKFELKKKLRNMNPAEREVFMTERRAELRQQLRDKKRDEVKQDDADINHNVPLIEGIPLELTDGMTLDQWARLVSLSEFVRSFKGLLGPASTYESGNLAVDDFCRAILSIDDKDRELLADIVCLFLKPLLQDGDLRIRKEMGVSLGEIPVTACTAGELLRLILPMSVTICEGEEEKEVELNDDVDCNHQNINTNTDLDVRKINELHTHYNFIVLPICDKLNKVEMYDLALEEKIIILEMLQNHILELDIISSFIDECHRETTEAYKSRLTDVKELNDKLRVVRQSMTEIYKLKSTFVIEEKVSEEKINLEEELVPSSLKRRLSLDIKNKEAEDREKRLDIERQYQKLQKEEANCKRLIEQAHNTYNMASNEAKQLMRVNPLGSDRNNCRYWQFRTACENVIYVEREFGDVNKGESVYSAWYTFNGVDEVNKLIGSLDVNGNRESALKKELIRILSKMSDLKEKIDIPENRKSDTNNDDNIESFLLRGFKDELSETELNIRQGALGGVEDFDVWDKRLSESFDLPEIKAAFVSVFLGVHERFWNNPLKSAVGRNDFFVAIENAVTQSRLNLLQYFLDVCICWSKSASDDKCRVCHKSSLENQMLLCDACNRAYHIFCLRPPLKNIPDGEWLCPACKPVDRAEDTDNYVDKLRPVKVKKFVKPHLKQDIDELLSEDDGVCCVCQTSEEGLGKCVSCGNNYHAQCHEPPLRNMRRTNWCCSNCRVEDSIKIKSGKNKRYTEDISSDSNNEGEEDEVSKKVKRGKKNHVVKKKVKEQDDEEVIIEKFTKKKNKKNSVKKISKNIESDEDDEIVGKKTRSGRMNGSKRKYDSEEEEESGHESDQDILQLNIKKNKRNHMKKTTKEEVSDESEEVVIKKTRARTSNGRVNGSKTKYEIDIEESVHESDQDASILQTSFTSGTRCSRKRKSVLENNTVIKRSKTVRDTKEHIGKTIKVILKQLITHKSSWPFREPVDEKDVPDYYTIIDNPMDLSTMTARHKLGVYDGEEGLMIFLKDIAQVFTNAEFYNEAGSAVMKLAVELEQFFNDIFTKCELGENYVR